MKKLMILFCAAMLCACGGGHKEKTYSHEENVEYLCALAHYSLDDFEYLSDGRIDTIADEFRKLNMKMSPYTSMKAITHELDEVWKLFDDNMSDAVYLKIAISRTDFHLHNPITWREYKPTEEYEPTEVYNPLRVCATPDGKHKFYKTPCLISSTTCVSETFHQYELDGNVECKLLGGKDWYSMDGVKEAWQFDYHDSTFYVLQGIYQEAGCQWRYSMNIVTFERDGALKRHDHFIPNDKLEYDIARTHSCLPAATPLTPKRLPLPHGRRRATAL